MHHTGFQVWERQDWEHSGLGVLTWAGPAPMYNSQSQWDMTMARWSAIETSPGVTMFVQGHWSPAPTFTAPVALSSRPTTASAGTMRPGARGKPRPA